MYAVHKDSFGVTEAVLAYHLHKELEHLKQALLDTQWYPKEFQGYVQDHTAWDVVIDPATAPLMEVHVRISLDGRLRSYHPDLLLHQVKQDIRIAVEIETTCSLQTLIQVSLYDAMSRYALRSTLAAVSSVSSYFVAVKPFVVAFKTPPHIAEVLFHDHIRLVDLLDATSEHFLAFPPKSPIGILQELITHENQTLLEVMATTEEYSSLNKIFIFQNLLLHGSDSMSSAIKELERKGKLNLETLEQEATKELPPKYIRYFTPEQLRGLTPEQLRGLTPEQLRGLRPEQLRGLTPEQLRGLTPEQLRGLRPEQLRGLTPEQLRGLTPEQQAVILQQLASDPEKLKKVIKQLPREAFRRIKEFMDKIEAELQE